MIFETLDAGGINNLEKYFFTTHRLRIKKFNFRIYKIGRKFNFRNHKAGKDDAIWKLFLKIECVASNLISSSTHPREFVHFFARTMLFASF